MANIDTNFDGLTKLRDWWGKVKQNFININDELVGNKVEYDAHIAGTTSRHNAEHINYSGTAGGSNAKEAIENIKADINNLSFTGSEHDALVTAALVDAEGEDFGSSGTGTYLDGRLIKWEQKTIAHLAEYSSQVIYLQSSGEDDTLDFQNALLNAENKLLVLEKGATYNISGKLLPPTGCKIIGSGATIINNITTQDQLFEIVNSGVEIYDLNIQNTENNPGNSVGESSYLSSDIFMNGKSGVVKNITLKNINIVNGIANSSAIIAVGAVENVKIENCTVDGANFLTLFHIEWSTGVVTPKNVVFENCTAKNLESTATNATAFWVSAGSRIKFLNCKAENCTRGFNFYTGDLGQEPENLVSISAENCHAINISKECFRVFTTGTALVKDMTIDIKNCHMKGADRTASDSAGVRIFQFDGALNIENCIVEDVRRGIYFGESAGYNCDNISIKHNKFNNIYLQAIYGYRLTNSIIRDNDFKVVNMRGNTNADDAVIFITKQSTGNSIIDNVFGDHDGTYTSRFYINLYSEGVDGERPTQNIIQGNKFIQSVAGGYNIVNCLSSDSYAVENYINDNAAINGAIMASGAVFFANRGGKKVVFTTTMPTTGTWRVGDYAEKTNLAVAGTAGSQYIIKGWNRVTTGSGNVLGTDWIEDRALTGT